MKKRKIGFTSRSRISSESGLQKIAWSEKRMPVLELLSQTSRDTRMFSECVIAACLHITPETAVLIRALKSGGADIYLCGSNPLSTQDDVAKSLSINDKVHVYAHHGATEEEYYGYMKEVVNQSTEAAEVYNKILIIIDDGADLITQFHALKKETIKIAGACEETTTGVNRLKAMAKDKVLRFPVVAVNDSATKRLFDNKYGTGQSALDGIIRATNILLAGKCVVVLGYGPCGEGTARCAKGLGAHVIVCEVDPIRALQAHYDGFTVDSIGNADKVGDVFITVTGNKDAIGINHLAFMKDGVILANAGHFDCEINLKDLAGSSDKILKRGHITEYHVGGKKLLVIGEGRLVNLVAAAGHPAEVMDMSFATQFMAVRHLLEKYPKLIAEIYNLPEAEQKQIATLKLQTLKVAIDSLTSDQITYLNSWRLGT